MKFLIENWYVIVGLLAVLECVIYAGYRFLKLPTKAQAAKVKEWLLWAVTNAEKELGGGTGKLKLRQVYDLFVQRFPAVAMAVSFDTFSQWVDDVPVISEKSHCRNGRGCYHTQPACRFPADDAF